MGRVQHELSGLPRWSARLRELRGDRTTREVANAAGIRYSRLNDYENGLRPSAEAAWKLARYYGIEMEEIWMPPVLPFEGRN